MGATGSFIRWPFVIEGILIGVAGGILAVVLLRGSYDALAFKIASAFPFLPVVSDAFLLNFIFISVALCGTVLGMIGGYISVSRLIKNA